MNSEFFETYFGTNIDLISSNANLNIFRKEGTRKVNEEAVINLKNLYFSQVKEPKGIYDLKEFIYMLTQDTLKSGDHIYKVESLVNNTPEKKTISFKTKDAEDLVKTFFVAPLKRWIAANVTDPDLKLIYQNWIQNPDTVTQIKDFVSTFSLDGYSGFFQSVRSKPDFQIVDGRTFLGQFTWAGLLSDLTQSTNKIGETETTFTPVGGGAAIQKPSKIDLPGILGFDNFLDNLLGTERRRGDRDARSVADLEEALKKFPDLFAKISGGARGVEYKEPTDEELISLRQCGLITRLLHDDAPIKFSNYFNTQYFSNSPLNSNGATSGHERIYCVDPAYDPNLFYNRCHISQNAKQRLAVYNSNDTQSNAALFKSLFWVFETKDGLKEIELALSTDTKDQREAENYYKLTKARSLWSSGLSTQIINARIKNILGESQTAGQIDLSIQQALQPEVVPDGQVVVDSQAYYFLNDIEIKYEGTNPSTARNDVQVQMSFTLSSMMALECEMATIPKKHTGTEDAIIKLYELITLPVTNKVAKGPGAFLQNQFNPEYSRVRLKVYTGDGDLCDLIIDLSTIDHSMSRESETGKTTLTINYRGFFEAMMNMPFNDALADQQTIARREKLHAKAMETIKGNDCKPELINKAVRMEQEIFRREAQEMSAMSLLSRLSTKRLIHGYQLEEDQVQARAINGTLDAFQDYVKLVSPGVGTISEAQIEKVQEQAKKAKEDEDTDAKDLEFLKNKFFFLGDLLYMVSGCLYLGDTPNMRPLVKNMNMRFMIGSINVPNPKTRDGSMMTINPACIPVDVAYFVEWFNSVIVNKGVTSYPVGIFIKELIERLINNIIFEVCFSSLLPSENPPVIRSTFISNFDDQGWFIKNSNGWFNPDKPNYRKKGQSSGFMKRQNLFKKDAQFNLGTSDDVYNVNPYNYCIIYQQFPTFSQYTTRDSTQKLRNTNYVPTIFYGAKNTNFNYVSSVSFAKTDSPFLREARYFNSNYGNLSLLSNVYDLNFSFIRRKANTFLYPGIIINFALLDWAATKVSPYQSISDNSANRGGEPDADDYIVLGQSNPHSPNTLAHILGFGGYYIIKSVVYKLGQTDDQFEIAITTKFMGTDAVKKLDRSSEDPSRIEDKQVCIEAFNQLADRVNELPGEESYERAQLETLKEDESSTPNEEKVTELTEDEFVEPVQEEAFDPQEGSIAERQAFELLLDSYLNLTKATGPSDKARPAKTIQDFPSNDMNDLLDAIAEEGIQNVEYRDSYRTPDGLTIQLEVMNGRLIAFGFEAVNKQ